VLAFCHVFKGAESREGDFEVVFAGDEFFNEGVDDAAVVGPRKVGSIGVEGLVFGGDGPAVPALPLRLTHRPGPHFIEGWRICRAGHSSVWPQTQPGSSAAST